MDLNNINLDDIKEKISSLDRKTLMKFDFYKILRDMGGKIVNLLDSFALSGQPHEDKIDIKVNGQNVISGYSYDSQSRSIKFLDGHIPNEGAKIEISYSIASQGLN